MKKMLSLFFVFYILSLSCVPVSALEISAKSAVVIDAASKRVLFEKDAYTRRGMASTTKVMTALVALERANADEIVTVSSFAACTEGSSIYLSPGEHISVGDLLYGLMLSSGNDAATALAEHIGGSVDAFTLLMNNRARQTGAQSTNFTNPHGLPGDEHYTTAYDLALIGAEAMENPAFREIVKTKNKTISHEGSEWDRSLSNHNKLLKMYEYATGIKTGFTKKDGRCLISSGEKNNLRLITVTLSAPDDWNDHISLMEYCFAKYKPYTVCTKGEKIGVLVSKSVNADNIEISYNEDYITALTEDEKGFITKKLAFKPSFPVKKGDKVGECGIYFGDALIGTVDLIAQNNSDIKVSFMSTIKQLMKGIVIQ